MCVGTLVTKRPRPGSYRYTLKGQPLMKQFLLVFVLFALPAFGQSNYGEIRVRVTDPSGLGVRATVEIVSDASEYHNSLSTDDAGRADIERLPFGVYVITVRQPSFAVLSQSAEVRSALPMEFPIRLTVAAVNQSIAVSAADTLIDPDQAGSVNQIGSTMIQQRVNSLPGRSLQDLVNSQPGWLYEGNAVLHPRGSEYQTQFVVDGVPLTDNRSPSFGNEIEADDVQDMTIYTAGIPAEYGRKMGGVVEVNTIQDSQPGFHGQVVLSGGSFDSASSFAQGQYVWGQNTLGASASGAMTSHYLNPVVPANFTNTGTTGDLSVRYSREITPKDRLSLSVRHELARYQIPNEYVQQTGCYAPGPILPAPCQRQNANNIETMGIASYQHIFTSNVVADFHAMGRDNANDFYSNDLSTPIIVFQHNYFREAYFKSSITVNRGRHEFKAGFESDNIFLRENFNYIITDPTQFDPDTPLTFSFPPTSPSQPSLGVRPDLEQAVFVEDRVHIGNWSVSAGLRWDHYQLLLNRQAVEPRFAISRYFPAAGVVAHFSYDRIFQTPSFENILLASSPTVQSLDPTVLRLPVQPSEGNYYEVGLTKGFFGKVRVDGNYFRRLVNNYADDDQIDNTSISFPIAFQKAIIYGAEGKIELLDWHHFSGYAAYSYIVGQAWFPVTGGLFIGEDATNAETQLTGHFPDSQDQRNTVRSRLRYQLTPRLWFAGGLDYGSGLPFDFDGTYAQALAQYGQQVVDRINFNRGRILPSLIVNASAGADVYSGDRFKVRFQADGENLTNVLQVIDFGGLFSGNAIGPSRSFALRLSTSF